MAASPTQRTLDYYRDLGYTIGITEKWIPQTRQRSDLYGFVDCLAFNPDETVAIQATSTGNMGARVKKIQGIPEAKRWLDHPDRKIVVVGWKRYAKAEDRKHWRPTIREMTMKDFTP